MRSAGRSGEFFLAAVRLCDCVNGLRRSERRRRVSNRWRGSTLQAQPMQVEMSLADAIPLKYRDDRGGVFFQRGLCSSLSGILCAGRGMTRWSGYAKLEDDEGGRCRLSPKN
jgi:hypothetical protein